jgi:hypothetical protein
MIEHYLGQPVLEFELNENLINDINEKMDKEIEEKKTINAVPMLSGKIKKEYKINHFFNSVELSKDIFQNIVKYTQLFNFDRAFNLKDVILDSAWINDQREGEYQIIHKHSGQLPIGLSCIIFLKVPDFGEEYTHEEQPMNGRTSLVSNSGGLFNNSNITINPKVGSMFVFPYDIQHVVYPFRGKGIRRSMSLNIDLHYKK